MTIFYNQSTEKNALKMNDASFASSPRHLRVYKKLEYGSSLYHVSILSISQIGVTSS